MAEQYTHHSNYRSEQLLIEFFQKYDTYHIDNEYDRILLKNIHNAHFPEKPEQSHNCTACRARMFHKMKIAYSSLPRAVQLYYTADNLDNYSDKIKVPDSLYRERVALFVHIYYDDTWKEVSKFFKDLPFKFDLYVNLVYESSDHIKEEILNDYPNAKISISSNIGKDVGGKLVLIEEWINSGIEYDSLAFLHDKKSHQLREERSLLWRNQLLYGLFSKSAIYNTLNMFNESRKPNVIPTGMTGIGKWMIRMTEKDPNIQYLNILRTDYKIGRFRDVNFIGGTMFWVKASIFKEFFTKNDPMDFRIQLQYDQLNEKEPSLMHAIERFFAHIVYAAGYKVQKSL